MIGNKKNNKYFSFSFVINIRQRKRLTRDSKAFLFIFTSTNHKYNV